MLKKIVLSCMLILGMFFSLYGCTKKTASSPKYEVLTEDEFTKYFTNNTVEIFSDEWNNLSLSEQFEQFEIDEKVLDKLSTNELMRIIMSYPHLHVIYLYDNNSIAHSRLSELFNAYEELFTRTDAKDEIEKWKNTSDSWGDDMSAQKAVVDMMYQNCK